MLDFALSPPSCILIADRLNLLALQHHADTETAQDRPTYIHDCSNGRTVEWDSLAKPALNYIYKPGASIDAEITNYPYLGIMAAPHKITQKIKDEVRFTVPIESLTNKAGAHQMQSITAHNGNNKAGTHAASTSTSNIASLAAKPLSSSLAYLRKNGTNGITPERKALYELTLQCMEQITSRIFPEATKPTARIISKL
jgi:hypothetical protein